MDKEIRQETEIKKSYEKPEVKELGKLSTLIQGGSKGVRDAYPLSGAHG